MRTSEAETSIRPTKYTHLPSCGLPVCMPLGQREGWGRTEGGRGVSNRQLTPERSAARFDAHLHSGLQGGKRCAQRLAHLRRLQLLSDSPSALLRHRIVFSLRLEPFSHSRAAHDHEIEREGEFIISIVRDTRTDSARSLTNNHVRHGRRLWMY